MSDETTVEERKSILQKIFKKVSNDSLVMTAVDSDRENVPNLQGDATDSVPVAGYRPSYEEEVEQDDPILFIDYKDEVVICELSRCDVYWAVDLKVSNHQVLFRRKLDEIPNWKHKHLLWMADLCSPSKDVTNGSFNALEKSVVSPDQHSHTLKHVAAKFGLPARETFGEPMTCEGFRDRIRKDTFELEQWIFHLFYDKVKAKYEVRQRRGCDPSGKWVPIPNFFF